VLDNGLVACYTQVVEKRIHARSAEVGWVSLYPAAGRIYSVRRGEEYTGLIGGIGFGVFTCILYLGFPKKSRGFLGFPKNRACKQKWRVYYVQHRQDQNTC
jgi:hypothetical protein